MTRARKVLRIVGGVLAAVLLVALAGLFAASQRASARLERRFDSHRIQLTVPTPLSETELSALREELASSAQPGVDPLAGVDLQALAQERAVARGKHLVEARYGCNGCHGPNLAGGVMLDDPAIGQIRGPNLTRGKGGLSASYSMADWDRAVRHGIKRDGTPSVMPAQDSFAMSDQELSDIVAYVRSLPAVDAQVPAPSFGPVGKVLLALGRFPLAADAHPDHQRAHLEAAPEQTRRSPCRRQSARTHADTAKLVSRAPKLRAPTQTRRSSCRHPVRATIDCQKRAESGTHARKTSHHRERPTHVKPARAHPRLPAHVHPRPFTAGRQLCIANDATSNLPHRHQHMS